MKTPTSTENSNAERLRRHNEAAERLQNFDMSKLPPGAWEAAIKEREVDAQVPPNPYIWPKDRKLGQNSRRSRSYARALWMSFIHIGQTCACLYGKIFASAWSEDTAKAQIPPNLWRSSEHAFRAVDDPSTATVNAASSEPSTGNIVERAHNEREASPHLRTIAGLRHYASIKVSPDEWAGAAAAANEELSELTERHRVDTNDAFAKRLGVYMRTWARIDRLRRHHYAVTMEGRLIRKYGCISHSAELAAAPIGFAESVVGDTVLKVTAGPIASRIYPNRLLHDKPLEKAIASATSEEWSEAISRAEAELRNSGSDVSPRPSSARRLTSEEFWREQRRNGLTDSKMREVLNSLPLIMPAFGPKVPLTK